MIVIGWVGIGCLVGAALFFVLADYFGKEEQGGVMPLGLLFMTGFGVLLGLAGLVLLILRAIF